MLKRILQILFLFFCLAIFLFAFTESEYPSRINRTLSEKGIIEEKIPEKETPIQVNYQWSYSGKNYQFQATFFESVWEFYNSRSKSYEYFGNLPANWEEEYYGMFLKIVKGDKSVQDVSEKILSLAKTNSLNEDQTVELIASFVQALPYDNAKADKIIKAVEKSDSGKPRYPYEVLYEKKGVCSGKSFLLVVLLREIGYGAALFEYENQNHLAVGIKCSQQYSTSNSGYCYIETTNTGHKIGIIPYLDPSNNLAVGEQELGYYNENQAGNSYKKPEGLRIYQKTSGRTYYRVKDTIASINEISNLKNQIAKCEKELRSDNKKANALNAEIEKLSKRLKLYKKEDDYENYNKLVPSYNDKVKKAEKKVKKYNKQVKEYNQLIDKYNAAVKNFN